MKIPGTETEKQWKSIPSTWTWAVNRDTAEIRRGKNNSQAVNQNFLNVEQELSQKPNEQMLLHRVAKRTGLDPRSFTQKMGTSQENDRREIPSWETRSTMVLRPRPDSNRWKIVEQQPWGQTRTIEENQT
jgi:hypothetical protein